MGEEIILSKSQLQNMINNLNACISVQKPPSMLQIVAYGEFNSRFFGILGLLLMGGAAETLAISKAMTHINTYVENFSTYQKITHRDVYVSWLNYMNAGNFVAIKIHPFNYIDLAEGVKFSGDIPNVVGYQQTNGNWVLPY